MSLYKHENGVSFRKVDATDLDALTSLKNESWFGTHRVAIVSRASQEKWLASLDAEDIHTPRNLVLIAAVENKDALDTPAPMPQPEGYYDGTVGLFKVLSIDWQSRRAAVGWDVYKWCRGKGLGKKIVKAGVDFCFDVLGLHRLQADVLANNTASIACAKHAGFVQEGLQSKCILRGGEWLDNIIFGIMALGTW